MNKAYRLYQYQFTGLYYTIVMQDITTVPIFVTVTGAFSALFLQLPVSLQLL